jgi:hypothetical protein
MRSPIGLPCVRTAIAAMASHEEASKELMLEVLSELIKSKNKRWKVVKGNKLKALIEETINDEKLKKLISKIEKDFREKQLFIPREAEEYIRDDIVNAGIDIEKYGGWYRCLAAYLILPRINVLTILADAKKSAEIDFRNRVIIESAERAVRAIMKEMKRST